MSAMIILDDHAMLIWDDQSGCHVRMRIGNTFLTISRIKSKRQISRGRYRGTKIRQHITSVSYLNGDHIAVLFRTLQDRAQGLRQPLSPSGSVSRSASQPTSPSTPSFVLPPMASAAAPSACSPPLVTASASPPLVSAPASHDLIQIDSISILY